jgi:hypothetical protein
MTSAVVIAAVVLLVIYRQFQTRPVSSRGLVIMPAILLVLAAQSLSKTPPSGDLATGAIVLETLVGIGLGVLRGRSVLVWRDESGTWWRRGTLQTALLWGCTVAVRIAIIVGARALGDHGATRSGPLELAFGVSLAAQFAVIAERCGFITFRSDRRTTGPG